MSTSFLTPLQLNKLEILQARLHQATSGAAPVTPVEGQVCYFADTHVPMCWNGTAWASMFGAAATFAAPAFTFGTANATGVATTGVRSDASIAIFDATIVSASAVGDTATTGAAGVAARRDHVHAREGFGPASAQTSFGGSASNGTALTVSHSDHVHGTPVHDDAAHAAIHLNALAAATAAYSMGSNKITNLAVASAASDAASLANRIDQFATPTTDVAWGTHKITGLLDPTSAQDAATKNYVDSVAQGLSVKGAVLAATTTVLQDTPAYVNGVAGAGATLTATVNNTVLMVDGQNIQTSGVGTRVLVKNQAVTFQNGIYTLTQASTAGLPWVLTRAFDMNIPTEFPSAFVFIEQGTMLADSGWTCTVNPPVTVGTTAITWAQFSGAGTYLADETTLHLAGGQFSILTTWAGQAAITTLGTIGTGLWQGTPVGIGFGGTGASAAVGARDSTHLGAQTAPAGAGVLGVVSIAARGIPTKVTAVVGDGAATTCTVNHNLGTRDVEVMVYRSTTPWDQVICDVQMVDINNVNLIFAVAPTASQFACVVIG